ncbi:MULTISPECIES: sensor domain-containing diguanylate cyclase [Methylomonas]|uniref:diguanylate cyclase n=2 Tax=Methylomonas TaxID=416 RepID=A0A140E6N5_9GAMM|nr:MULTISPECIES: sensor domain-containing diguanylate cyclase [Methylomonas]AMK79059.1 diguanylate cyclase [Methylomonas denitrificans]OAI00221.1 diguanylate cyclase [Methylomonas methanica]TCV79147.1 diguanylate cyclase (GGDEF)-like protein [Methylomonas methanica]
MNQQSADNQDAKLTGFGVQDLLIDLVNALSAVKQLSEIDYQVDDEKALIRQALASLIQYQDMERCSFFIVDSDGFLSNVAGISILELANSEASVTTPLRFKVGEGLIGAAAASGVLQHCQNCHEDRRFEKSGKPDQLPGSVISVPVFTFNRTLIGVLNVSHPQANYFSEWHIRLLEVYKNILGQLITTRRLVQQMEQQIAFRTAELESLVAETNQLKDHFASMSMHDQLTGLHNRRFFYDQVEVVIAHHKRYKNSFCLLVMDIDHFKVINDRFGHLFGDQVLTGVANALKRQVRNTDILVRFGGEEFVAIFTNTRCDNGRTFAERIRQEIKTLEWFVDNEVVNLTLSIGLYCLNGDLLQSEQMPDIDQMINYADAALYQAKAGGRDQTVVFGEFRSDRN